MKNTKNIKSNTKRIIALALVFVLVATLFTACGNNADADKSTTSNTSSSTTAVGESEAIVPSIDDGEETTTAEAGTANAGTTTANAGTATTVAGDKNTGDKNTGKPASESTTRPAKKPAQKPVTTTRPSSSDKPSAGKPASETTTKPSSSGTNPTAKTAYFRASTGEKIEYYKYKSLNGATCTGISESNGKITATYDKGANNEWIKCDNCGKYLCEGCQPAINPSCPKCGRTNCMTYSRDVTCYRCGKYVKANTCHPCNGGLPGYEGPYVRGESDIIF